MTPPPLPLTPQAYFSLLRKTSLEGGFPAVTPSTGKCAYRAPDGRACAVGILLTDEQAQEAHEDDSAVAICKGAAKGTLRVNPEDLVIGATPEFLNRVQTAHDLLSGCWDHQSFVHKLRNTFAAFNMPTEDTE